tara:strand:- start:758 stop:1036 length:279 start_codon:yes stop_codon:yes gene_type:complete
MVPSFHARRGRSYNPIITGEGGCRNCDKHQRGNPTRTVSCLWCGDSGFEEAIRFLGSPLLRSGVFGLGGTRGILLFVREDITNETGMQKMWY